MLIAVLKNKFTVPYIIIFSTLSFPIEKAEEKSLSLYGINAASSLH